MFPLTSHKKSLTHGMCLITWLSECFCCKIMKSEIIVQEFLNQTKTQRTQTTRTERWRKGNVDGKEKGSKSKLICGKTSQFEAIKNALILLLTMWGFCSFWVMFSSSLFAIFFFFICNWLQTAVYVKDCYVYMRYLR